MTSSSSNPMEIVSALMLERQRYEGWLGTLESRRSDTPPHVYERVRGDYEARLQAVMTQLSQRTSELQETVSVLEARLARVLAEENAKRDAKYEAELRAAVGEFTPSEWNALLTKSDDEINRLSSERGGIATELARVRQIYAMASNRAQTEQTAMSQGTGFAESGAGRADAGGKKDVKDTGRTSKAVASGAASAGFDELAFLNSLGSEAGTKSSSGHKDGSGAQPTGSAVAPRAPTPSASAAGIAKAVPAPAASGAPAAHTGSGQPHGDVAQHEGSPGAPAAKSDTKPAAPKTSDKSDKSDVSKRRETNGVPSFLKDVPVEQIKTLKCAECGTMNYPTEWYCERCGGELAAM